MVRSHSSSCLSGVNSLTCKDRSLVMSQMDQPISGGLSESLPARLPQSAQVADPTCVSLATSVSLHLRRSWAGELRRRCSEPAVVQGCVPISTSNTLEKAWTRALSLTSLCSLQRLCSSVSPGRLEPNAPVTRNNRRNSSQ